MDIASIIYMIGAGIAVAVGHALLSMAGLF